MVEERTAAYSHSQQSYHAHRTVLPCPLLLLQCGAVGIYIHISPLSFDLWGTPAREREESPSCISSALGEGERGRAVHSVVESRGRGFGTKKETVRVGSMCAYLSVCSMYIYILGEVL